MAGPSINFEKRLLPVGVDPNSVVLTTDPRLLAVGQSAGGGTSVSVGSVTITGSGKIHTGTYTLTIAGTASVSGTNNGDQTITLTGGVTGSGTGSFAATVVTNANLTGPITSVGNATAVAAQTGTGSTFVMQASPTLTTPNIGAATATSVNGMTITSSTGTFTLTNGKTLAVTNTLTLSGTDSTTMTFPSSTATIAGLGIVQTWSAAQTFGDGNMLLRNPANTFSATIKSGAITAARTHTFPNATGTVCSTTPTSTLNQVLCSTSTSGIVTWRALTTDDIPLTDIFSGAVFPDTINVTDLAFFSSGISINEGSNKTMGVATLVAGTVTVNTNVVTANSRIFLSVQSLGTVTVPTAVAVTARTAGTSFTITSANVLDTSVVAWMIVEPY